MMKYKKSLNKQFLYQEYIINNKSCQTIAKEIGCCHDTIWRSLIKNDISIRTLSEALKGVPKATKCSKILTKEFLYEEYIINKKNTYQIAKEFNCSPMAVYNYLIKHGISIRTKSESKKLINNFGKTAPNYVDGRYSKIYYCKEKGCDNEISYENHRSGQGQCEQCAGKKHAKRQLGKNNGMYGKHHTKEAKASLSLTHGGTGIPYEYSEYPLEFDKNLKQQIRKRDNYICQKCKITEEEHLIVYGRILGIHHIDYDKENCKEDNLITLCNVCNSRVNFNRKYWKEYFNKCIYEMDLYNLMYSARLNAETNLKNETCL